MNALKLTRERFLLAVRILQYGGKVSEFSFPVHHGPVQPYVNHQYSISSLKYPHGVRE